MGQTIRQPDSTTAGACLLANKAFAVACAVFVIALAPAGCGEEETPPPPADAPSSATAPADAVPDAEPASSPVSDPEPATHTKSPPEPPKPTSTSPPPTEPATAAVEPDGEDALLSRIDREIAGLPDHLREPMEEIRHLERTARFSEAFREARQLFAEAEDYEHQQFLTATLRRLREARQEAVSLRFGIDELGQPASRRRRVAGQELLEAGPVGMALLREAVLERSADVAGQAARLLALADDPLAAPVLAKRLRETEDAELRNALLEAMARLAGDLPPQLVREFYRQVREGERFERLAEAEVVAEFLQKGAAGDEKTFNKLMGDDDAYAWLKELVKDAQLSGEPRLVEWAARMAERFELMIMRDLALWLAPGQGVKTDESGRVTRWADQSGAAHHAVQPSDTLSLHDALPICRRRARPPRLRRQRLSRHRADALRGSRGD